MFQRVFSSLLGAVSTLSLLGYVSVPAQAHSEDEAPFQISGIQQQRELTQVIPAREIELTPAEQRAGITVMSSVMPVLETINQRYNVMNPTQFNYYIRNFHYPYRQRFHLEQRTPPTQVVLHWTANRRTDIPLYTFSAFLRSQRGRQIVERPNRYKNVSNYLLTGELTDHQGQKDTYLLKLTRGDVASWGDIPRVTAFPSDDSQDNKYDGLGALGIEIESPNFRQFYYNQAQRDKLHNFLLMVLSERGKLSEFASLRNSPHWEDMTKLYRYLANNTARIDVDNRGGITSRNQHLDIILKDFPDLSRGVYSEAKRIYQFISGHGIVAREYNERMLQAGRPREANYDKIDFTEAQVFVVAMEMLQSDLQPRGQQLYDLDTLRMMQSLKEKDKAPVETPQVAEILQKQFLPSGRQVIVGHEPY